MHVQTQRFGQIDVPEHAVIHFPDGILGFPQLRRGCLLPYQPRPRPVGQARPDPVGQARPDPVGQELASCPSTSVPKPPSTSHPCVGQELASCPSTSVPKPPSTSHPCVGQELASCHHPRHPRCFGTSVPKPPSASHPCVRQELASCPSTSVPEPPPQPEPILRWLQSLDDPSLLFLTVEPYLIFPDYDVELSDADAGALHLESADYAAVLTLITISQPGKARRDAASALCASASRAAVTTNLLAPIVINTRTRRARQVILDSDRYLTKHIIGAQIEEDLNAGADPKTR